MVTPFDIGYLSPTTRIRSTPWLIVYINSSRRANVHYNIVVYFSRPSQNRRHKRIVIRPDCTPETGRRRRAVRPCLSPGRSRFMVSPPDPHGLTPHFLCRPATRVLRGFRCYSMGVPTKKWQVFRSNRRARDLACRNDSGCKARLMKNCAPVGCLDVRNIILLFRKSIKRVPSSNRGDKDWRRFKFIKFYQEV